jgi:L-ascorbate metabolism protein UlaG (beta-lactamase superfamily)
MNWLTNSEFKPNEELVRKRLTQIGVEKADGVFSSHTHFDHAVDVAQVAKITNATVYGGPSLERVVKNHWSDVRFRDSPDDAAIHLGAFTVHTLKRQHGPIFGSWKFQHGDVPADFTSKFYEYREGETWSFYVEHPAGNILIDQGARFFSGNEKWIGRVSYVVVTESGMRSATEKIQEAESLAHMLFPTELRTHISELENHLKKMID